MEQSSGVNRDELHNRSVVKTQKREGIRAQRREHNRDIGRVFFARPLCGISAHTTAWVVRT